MNSPIGIFDSGVGGLTVFREIVNTLPHEPTIYLGDTAHLPYGNKSSKAILRYSTECAQFLLQKGVKLLVIACHTASSHALEHLQATLSIPVVGMIRPSLDLIRSSGASRIALLATQSTLAANQYQHLIFAESPQIKLFLIPCPLFAPLVEEGLHQHPLADQLAALYLHSLRRESIDAALLACTHYQHLKGAIEKALNPSIRILDPAERCAKIVERELQARNLLCSGAESPQRQFFVTDNPERFSALAAKFPSFPQERAKVKLAFLEKQRLS